MVLRGLGLALGVVLACGGTAGAQDSFGGSFGGSFDSAPPPPPPAVEAVGEARLVRANDMEFVAAELRRHGYEAEIRPWLPERPYVGVKRGGLHSDVFSGWCFPDRPSCLMLRFRLELNMPEAAAAATLARWNRDNLGTRAFIGEDGQTTLMMDVITGEDGLSEEGFLRAADIWNMQIDAFTAAVGFRR